jgi:phosphoribosylanthranilate isomerase
MKTKIKICGITNLIDAKNALNLGADYLGFINVLKSPRYITIDEIEAITVNFTKEELSKFVLLTQEENISNLLSTINRLAISNLQIYTPFTVKELNQFHKENLSIFLPVPVESYKDLELINDIYDICDLVILDNKSTNPDILGGTGESFDWSLFNKAKAQFPCKFALSGGLNPLNIEEAIKCTRPFMVDASSGLESKLGFKSLDKMRDFITLVRKMDQSLIS